MIARMPLRFPITDALAAFTALLSLSIRIEGVLIRHPPLKSILFTFFITDKFLCVRKTFSRGKLFYTHYTLYSANVAWLSIPFSILGRAQRGS